MICLIISVIICLLIAIAIYFITTMSLVVDEISYSIDEMSSELESAGRKLRDMDRNVDYLVDEALDIAQIRESIMSEADNITNKNSCSSAQKRPE